MAQLKPACNWLVANSGKLEQQNTAANKGDTLVNLARRHLFNRAPKAHISSEAPTRMPWLVEEQDFINGCTRCGQCIDVCETAIIIKGSGGFPEVNFDLGECTFCQQCVNACPEPVFKSLSDLNSPSKEAWQHVVQIGDKCLAKQGVECRVCADNCDYSAIKFWLQVGGAAQPILSDQNCTGCGACIKPCPTDAISIGNT